LIVSTMALLAILLLFIRWIASSYEDRQFYNRVQRRQELIKRYTSED